MLYTFSLDKVALQPLYSMPKTRKMTWDPPKGGGAEIQDETEYLDNDAVFEMQWKP